ncbi:hypothetical protein BLA29_010860, partial [Euroglyphus maynei]
MKQSELKVSAPVSTSTTSLQGKTSVIPVEAKVFAPVGGEKLPPKAPPVVQPMPKAMSGERSSSIKNSGVQQMTKKSAFVPSKIRSVQQPTLQHAQQQTIKSKVQDFDAKISGQLQPFKRTTEQQLMAAKDDRLSMSKSSTIGPDGKSSMTDSSLETRETLSIKISQGKDTTEITQVIEKKSPSSKRRKQRSRSPPHPLI